MSANPSRRGIDQEQDEPGHAGCNSISVENDVFTYDGKGLEYRFIEWPSAGESFLESKFDELLSQKWNNVKENNGFWYSLDEVKIRNIDGRVGFIAQLNTKRFKERRKPEEINFVKQPFRNDKFNFNKVKQHEVLFKIKSTIDEITEEKKDKENLIIINVSPIDYGHSMLVPDITSLHSQALNEDALRLSIHICLLSTHRGLRIGFNSLCAFASVNHLHLHILYINHILPLDKVIVSPIAFGLYELVDYPVRGFALQLENHDIKLLARKVAVITTHLYDNDIPHNLFICRHEPFNTQNDVHSAKESTVRVFIFPKLPAAAITEFPFNPAVLEIAGYLPIKDEKEFEDLDETNAVRILNVFCYREDEFAALKDDISFLIQNLDTNN